MTTDSINFKFECPKCNGTEVSLPDDHTDESIATCKSCGVSFGKWGDIRVRAMQMAKDEVRSQFKNALKGLKNRKLI